MQIVKGWRSKGRGETSMEEMVLRQENSNALSGRGSWTMDRLL